MKVVIVLDLAAEVRANYGGGKPLPVAEFLKRVHDCIGDELSDEAKKKLEGKETLTPEEAWEILMIHKRGPFIPPVSCKRISYSAAA